MKNGVYKRFYRNIRNEKGMSRRELAYFFACPCGHTDSSNEEPSHYVCVCDNKGFYDGERFHVFSVTVLEDDKRIKLSISGQNYRMLFENDYGEDDIRTFKNVKLQAYRNSFTLSLSKETGRTYKIKFPQRTVQDVSRYGVTGRDVREAFYAALKTPAYAKKVDEFIERLSSRIPDKILAEWNVDSQGKNSEEKIGMLTLLNAYPHLHHMGKAIPLFSKEPKKNKLVRQAAGGTEAFKAICPALTKRSIKMLRKLPNYTIGEVLSIVQVMKNKDHIHTLIERKVNKTNSNYQLHDEDPRAIIEVSYIRKRLLKKFIRHFYGDVERFERAMVQDMHVDFHFQDSIRMYADLLKEMDSLEPSDLTRFKKEFFDVITGNLKSVHDGLSQARNMINRANKIIPYRKEEINQLSYSGQTIQFRPAIDTHELLHVGKAMHICVGSYDRMALEKSLAIVIGFKDEEPVLCIELQGNELRQVKKSRNQRLFKNDIATEDFQAWMKQVSPKVFTNDLCEIDVEKELVTVESELIEENPFAHRVYHNAPIIEVGEFELPF
ncbi:PcfJ domain-containing protein [Psychrobacillus sp. FSL H8-0510]|uniref:PcfJ domain-containing protein n=1 Tax=Psychrobacillus sp. FSL H8-0510 TaxID=2921394 RepID=UPI0030F9400B